MRRSSIVATRHLGPARDAARGRRACALAGPRSSGPARDSRPRAGCCRTQVVARGAATRDARGRAVGPELRARSRARAADRDRARIARRRIRRARRAAALNSARLRIYSNDDLVGRGAGRRAEERGRHRRGHLRRPRARAQRARGPRHARPRGDLAAGRGHGRAPGDLQRASRDWATSCSPAPAIFRATARSACASRRARRLDDGARATRATWPKACTRRAPRASTRARIGIEMPITEAVCAVLFEGRPAPEAVRQLLTRDPRPER